MSYCTESQEKKISLIDFDLDKAFAENTVTKTTHHAKHIKKSQKKGKSGFQTQDFYHGLETE